MSWTPAILALVVLGVIVIAWKRRKAARQIDERKRETDDFAPFNRLRKRQEVARLEIDKVRNLVLNLPVVTMESVGSQSLTRDALGRDIDNFMLQSALTGIATSTQMLHVVLSPRYVTVFVRLRPTEPEAAAREYLRVGEATWVQRTKHVKVMEAAVRAAEAESQTMARNGSDETPQ